MATTWQDRVPTYPNRYKITKSDGTSEYVTLERADEPSVEGTPINAVNMNAIEIALLNKMNIGDGVKSPVFINTSIADFDDLFEIGKTTIHTCVGDLDHAPDSTNEFVVVTTGYSDSHVGVQVAISITETPKMYMRRLMGEWGNWIQYVGAEYDVYTNTLNFIM